MPKDLTTEELLAKVAKIEALYAHATERGWLVSFRGVTGEEGEKLKQIVSVDMCIPYSRAFKAQHERAERAEERVGQLREALKKAWGEAQDLDGIVDSQFAVSGDPVHTDDSGESWSSTEMCALSNMVRAALAVTAEKETHANPR